MSLQFDVCATRLDYFEIIGVKLAKYLMKERSLKFSLEDLIQW
jgi:hypothetical protein